MKRADRFSCSARMGVVAVTALVSAIGCASGGFSPQPPDLRGEPKLWVPAFSTKRLSNGLTVHVNPDPYLPMVSVAVGIRGGYLSDPPIHAGLTRLLVTNLLARTERFDRMAMAASYDAIGAPVSFEVLADGIVLSLEALEDRAAGALKLLAEVLSRPGFDPAELERTRAEQLSALENGLGRPETVALWGLRQVMFGPRHPMGLPVYGTRSSIARLSLADLQSRARQILRPERTVLVVSGNV
ncbi:MAG TPA: insulinase family protein, partial [Polyangia bacterium]